MKASVAFVNPRNGFLAAKVESGDYVVIEILGGYGIEIGDNLQGDFRNLGGATILNETQREKMDVFIQDFDCSVSRAKNLVYLN